MDIKAVVKTVRYIYEETHDPRVVLVGVEPLRIDSDYGIETFAPYFDIDDDGFLEVAGSWLPADEEILSRHIEAVSRIDFDKRREKEDIVIVIQPEEYKFID